LKQLLTESGYDVNRYEPLGLDLVIDSGNLDVFVICIDKLNYDSNNKNVSKCLLRNNGSINFQKLFRNLNISLFASHLDSSDYISKNNKIVYLERDDSGKQIEDFVLELGKD